MIFGNNVSLNNNELQNVLLQKLAADPANVTAKIYYNTTSNTIKYYNGTSWQTLGTGTGSGDVIGPASSVNGQNAIFSGTTGKIIQADTLTASVVKASSGVYSAAVAGTDYLAPAAIGTTVQAYDATLAALASYNTNGILTQTAADTFTGRTITGTANEITVTDGNGVAGNPTLSLPSALTFTGKTVTGGTFTTPTINVNANVLSIRDNTDTTKILQFNVSGVTTATTRTLTVPNASGTIALTSDLSGYQTLDATLTALAGLNATAGVLVQTAADTFTKRTLTGTANRIVITNGDGVSGNPTFDIGTDVVTATSTHAFTNKTFDANGTGNSISNLEVADFAANVVDNDNTLAANSSTRIPTQQAVKGYVDNAIAGVDWKEAVRVATTAAGTLGTSFANGQTVDGITLATGDRILIKNQATQTENGIYIVAASGAPTRATDADTGTEIWSAAVYVRQGTANAGTNWVNNNTSAITVGVTNITFAQFQGQVQPAATTTSSGIVELATQAEAEAKSSTTVVLTPASIVNFTQKKTFTIGDTAATSFALTHNLNTQDITVSVRKVSTNEQWITDVTCNTVNQVTITFATAPTTNEFVVTVIG